MNQVEELYQQWTVPIRTQLNDLVRYETSINIGFDRLTFWHSRLSPVLRAAGVADAEELVRRINRGDENLRRQVVDAMTTHETLFFRDGATFEETLATLIPEAVQRLGGQRPLTIWSAASSSGQEIYSVAFFLDRCFPELLEPGRVQLIASDVSHAMVDRVAAGRFTPLEVRRGLPQHYRDAYLKFDGESWVAPERLRKVIQVRQVNLAKPLTSIPRCDLVLLRNVLIYFDDAERETLLKQLACEILAPHGAVVVGASEILTSRHFRYQRLNAGALYRPLVPARAGL